MASRTYYSEEAEMAAKKQQGMQIVVVLLIGLTVGAALALLYAPKEGKKTRKKLGKESKKTRRMLGKEIGGGIESGREMADDVVKDAVHALEDQFKTLRSEMDKLLNSVKN